MSDRLSPSNGKRDVFWGTLRACPVCGRCLCYGCHPQGPCVDEREAAAQMQPVHQGAAHEALTSGA